jgi:thioredoxin reductase
MLGMYDAIVIGGGAAGLSAALVLGRARRDVLVLDAGAPSNAPAHGIGGLLGHEGRPPVELLAAGRAELGRFSTVEVRDATAAHGQARADGTFAVDGEAARTVLLATGMRYAVPDLPGAAELWGADLFHCPFCHGWEARDRRIAVLGDGAAAEHMLPLLRGWSADVVHVPDAVALEHEDGRLRAVRTAGGLRVAAGAAWTHAPLEPRDDLPEQLGAERDEHGSVRVAPDGATTVPGVWAAGDLVTRAPSVAGAIATGHLAAARIAHAVIATRPG